MNNLKGMKLEDNQLIFIWDYEGKNNTRVKIINLKPVITNGAITDYISESLSPDYEAAIQYQINNDNYQNDDTIQLNDTYINK